MFVPELRCDLPRRFLSPATGDRLKRYHQGMTLKHLAALVVSAVACVAPSVSASQGQPAAPAGQAPYPELRGLTKLGVVVEELSPQAAACGLSLAPIEETVSKSLADAGFAVRRNPDEDTYVYKNVRQYVDEFVAQIRSANR